MRTIVEYFIQLLQPGTTLGPTNSDKRSARTSTVERTLLTALTRPRSAIIPYRAPSCRRTSCCNGLVMYSPALVWSHAGTQTRAGNLRRRATTSTISSRFNPHRFFHRRLFHNKLEPPASFRKFVRRNLKNSYIPFRNTVLGPISQSGFRLWKIADTKA